MWKKSLISSIGIMGMILMSSSCTKTNGHDITTTSNGSKSSAKEITEFIVAGVSADITGHTVTATVPSNTDTSALAPTITVSDGASVDPASGVSQNFKKSAVLYTVTAEDGTINYYIASVGETKEITAFSIGDSVGVINGTDITVTVPFDGTNIADLTPTITTSVGASVTPASGITQDFTYPVLYFVTALDESIKIYTVTVTVAPPEAITAFSFPEGTGVIDEMNNISVVVPYNTVGTVFTPTIEIVGSSVSPASGIAQDFAAPVTYTVTGIAGGTTSYTVTVYNIGGPGGGLVFYIDETGEHGLEAAPTNQSESTQAWSDIIDASVGITGTEVGTGAANTALIIAQSINSVAYRCSSTTIGGYSDWFLPSKDELNLMYTNLAAISVVGLGSVNYWSSSENDESHVWTQYFGDGFQHAYSKDFAYYVRCVRFF